MTLPEILTDLQTSANNLRMYHLAEQADAIEGIIIDIKESN